MKSNLRILILEDVPADAELMEDELKQSGFNYEARRVAGRAAFIKELAEFSPDLILADYSLPGFDGRSALNIIREKYPDIPFIFVSGALGEELAIELLKKGATDYVLKNRLFRLAPAVKRALAETAEHQERKRAENELRQKSKSLEEANIALKVLLQHRDEDRKAIEEKIITNVKKLALPYIEKLKTLKLNENQLAYVRIIEDHLNDIISPFLRNLTMDHLDFTPREIQITALVKEGKTTKDITELLNISATAVDFHRKNIRQKLGIKNEKTNLRSYLLSLPAKND
ncbi:MAG TPA: response regulator [Smithellaceae bacterium]|nr:response regulator [Smithellaceae bacterium]